MLETIVAYLLAKPVVGLCAEAAFVKGAQAYCDSSRIGRCEFIESKLNERMVTGEQKLSYQQEYKALECDKFMPKQPW